MGNMDVDILNIAHGYFKVFVSMDQIYSLIK